MTARVSSRRFQILGTGAALPGEPVSSAQLLANIRSYFGIPTTRGAALARMLDIETRHFSRTFTQRMESPIAGFRNPDLAALALTQALNEASTPVKDLQYLIGHTASPARLMPPNITEVAAQAGFDGPCAELRQACTGFANALQWASAMLDTPEAPPVALVGSEVGSVYFDPTALIDTPEQWVNLMQMGDGAGAIVLGPDNSDVDGTHAFLESAFYGHMGGEYSSGFAMNEGGSDYPALRPDRSSLYFSHDYHTVKSRGSELFHAGVETITTAGYTLNDFQWIIPHQVSGRIGTLLGQALGIPPERFFVNANRVGNLGSAAIWVALHQLRCSGLLTPGARVLILGAEATRYMYGGFVYVHGDSA